MIVRSLILALILLVSACGGEEATTLTLGVGTTVQDSGLLDAVLPRFREAHPGLRVRYIAAGSGELLALGERGDVDVMISHSPAAEREFMAAGHGALRARVMHNDFVIVGPRSDPAAVRGMRDAAAAFARIAAANAPFLSRGDDSGTHRKELEVWSAAQVDSRGTGYREEGEGIAAVLRAASELGAYTIADRGTFLNLRETLDLEILVEGDPRLLNVYHVIVPTRSTQPDAARAFADWITSDEGQEAIGAYGKERFGRPLFRPSAGESTTR
jgi:tungstate transport system substrate-binding protein